MADAPWPGDISAEVKPGTRFLLQIVGVDAPHPVARFPAGGPLEVAFIEACTEAIMARGVGLLKGTEHVRADVRAGLEAAIAQLKRQTRGVPP